MRTTIIRSTAFAAIFILPLFLTPSRDPCGFASSFGVSTASADGSINRLFRWTGYGWSCGYHACNNNGWGLRDGLPPVGNTARKHQSAGPAQFELVDPRHTVAHPVGYAVQGHHHGTFVQQEYIETSPMQSAPMDHVGESLVIPQQTQPGRSFQPYQSAIPPKSPKTPAIDPVEKEAASPSDLEVLPSPKAEQDKLDELLEDDSAQLVPPRNRSASQRAGSRVR